MTVVKITISIKKDLIKDFQIHCKKNDWKVSTRIQRLIQRDMEE